MAWAASALCTGMRKPWGILSPPASEAEHPPLCTHLQTVTFTRAGTAFEFNIPSLPMFSIDPSPGKTLILINEWVDKWTNEQNSLCLPDYWEVSPISLHRVSVQVPSQPGLPGQTQGWPNPQVAQGSTLCFLISVGIQSILFWCIIWSYIKAMLQLHQKRQKDVMDRAL